MQTLLCSIQEWNQNHIISAAIDVALLKVYNASAIYQRFDAFILLIEACDRHSEPADIEIIKKLREQALQFALAIVDARDEEQLEEKVSVRVKYKAIDPEYMPWHTPTTRTDITKSKTRKEYVKNSVLNAFQNILHKRYSFVRASKVQFDAKEKVQYLSATEREKYRIFPSNGVLKKMTVTANGDEACLVLNDFSTANERTFEEKGSAIYVVSPKGDMFAGSTIPRVFHHSSFLAGGATISSGSVKSPDGALKTADDFSGHYMPQFQQAIQTIAFFRKAKLITNSITYERLDENTLSMTTYEIRK
jgi:hypothetical protein